jgi:hypothetical protein
MVSPEPEPSQNQVWCPRNPYNAGTSEHTHQIANHESPDTTELFDRTGGQNDLDEIEKHRI